MSTKKFLAIGGPEHGQWLPDMGHKVIVPKPMPPIKFNSINPPIDLDNYLQTFELQTDTYSRQRFGDGSGKYKDIYVWDSYRGDVIEALKRYLLEQFMLMEDPESE